MWEFNETRELKASRVYLCLSPGGNSSWTWSIVITEDGMRGEGYEALPEATGDKIRIKVRSLRQSTGITAMFDFAPLIRLAGWNWSFKRWMCKTSNWLSHLEMPSSALNKAWPRTVLVRCPIIQAPGKYAATACTRILEFARSNPPGFMDTKPSFHNIVPMGVKIFEYTDTSCECRTRSLEPTSHSRRTMAHAAICWQIANTSDGETEE